MRTATGTNDDIGKLEADLTTGVSVAALQVTVQDGRTEQLKKIGIGYHTT